jgi:hypothetical protein
MLSMFPDAVQKSFRDQADQVLAFQRQALDLQLSTFDWQSERLAELRAHSLAGLDLGQKQARALWQRSCDQALAAFAQAAPSDAASN